MENAIRDMTHQIDTREREFAVLDYPAAPAEPALRDMGAKVEKLEDGFYSISGAAVDAQGKLYFVDKHQQRIYGWSREEGLSVERDNPTDPVNLAFDKSGNLLVLSSLGAEGTLYTFRPGSPATRADGDPAHAGHGASRAPPCCCRSITGTMASSRTSSIPTPIATPRSSEMFARDMAAPKAKEYVSPDGSLVLPAARTFSQGPPDGTGWRFSDNLDTYGFATAKPGSRVFVSNESEGRTYSGLVGANGTRHRPEAVRRSRRRKRGGGGRMAMSISPTARCWSMRRTASRSASIDVPERPLQILFGGADGRTLFILTHHALYAVKI